jgi:hypothetical protein
MSTGFGDTDSRTKRSPVVADGDRYYEDDEEYTTETRRSLATSEFWVFVVLSAVIVLFAYESGTDTFTRDDAWKCVAGLGIAYLVSRGLAKAGSYETFIRRRRN